MPGSRPYYAMLRSLALCPERCHTAPPRFFRHIGERFQSSKSHSGDAWYLSPIQLRNCLTIDLESISHRYVTERGHLSELGRRSVEAEENRRALDGGSVASSTRRILDALRKCGHKATFFVVGEVYDWHSDLIEEISEQGHELAYHSHTHTPIRTVDSLSEELQKSRKLIETFRPKGFRAPRAWIRRECLSELARCGFVYDSSSYGPYSASAKISGILEVPISTYAPCREKKSTLPRPLSFALLRNLEIPFGSGYFVSFLSLVSPTFVSYFVKKSNLRGMPAILSLHPWQLYRRPADSSWQRGLYRMGMLPYDLPCDRAFGHLLRSHSFCTVSELIEDTGALG